MHLYLPPTSALSISVGLFCSFFTLHYTKFDDNSVTPNNRRLLDFKREMPDNLSLVGIRLNNLTTPAAIARV